MFVLKSCTGPQKAEKGTKGAHGQGAAQTPTAERPVSLSSITMTATHATYASTTTQTLGSVPTVATRTTLELGLATAVAASTLLSAKMKPTKFLNENDTVQSHRLI